eukprot:gnl/TRDRNA2_/TRDRNA2_202788_c0_seq1.p1 gnl/TRDRNA2_/TRDRNA2_202788_c0~~gnl/TRDRNA2_/TRDRNA2_202788_c0_seq1.p1  ORF type:complete len:192 (+),score=44.46 gnl/TRDRNA2_/TRDRNA2_202788_c0_seq1:34-576(+)
MTNDRHILVAAAASAAAVGVGYLLWRRSLNEREVAMPQRPPPSTEQPGPPPPTAVNGTELAQRRAGAKPAGPVQLAIEKAVKEALLPDYFEVTNESHGKHSDESHFHVLVVASKFEGMRAIERSRLVTSLFTDDAGKLKFHALRITARTPAQWAASPVSPEAPKCTGAGDGRGPTDVSKF